MTINPFISVFVGLILGLLTAIAIDVAAIDRDIHQMLTIESEARDTLNCLMTPKDPACALTTPKK